MLFKPAHTDRQKNNYSDNIFLFFGIAYFCPVVWVFEDKFGSFY